MTYIFHITHTEINSDSRILKEMGSLASAGFQVGGLGVTLDEGAKRSEIGFEANICAIQLRTRRWTFLPRTLRHVASLCELVVKMLPRAIKQKPDVVHCHDTLVLPLGVIVKLFTRAKLVYDAHELESDRNGLTPLQGRLTLWAEKLLWRFVDALIVVSPSIQSWYLQKLGAKPSAVIMNAPLYDDDGVSGGSYLRERFNIPPDQRIFIYVGILGTGRGLDLITAAFTHPAVVSHVVFLGYGDLAETLKTLASQHSNIHVHEAVPHSQVVSIVKSADFGLCLVQNVSLSDYYCLPNKLFEYCFAGVPILASDFPDIKKVLEAYGIGECCNLDAFSVREAVIELANSEKSFLFSDLIPLSWQAQEQKLQDLYRQLLNPSSTQI
jgi:glycosyltransferase involved in cell wall biosynthesis